MANTLTALAPTLFSAAKEVAAEPFGVISALNATFDDKGVAKGDTVSVPIAPVRAASDFTPAATTTAGTDATATTTPVLITASKKVDWNITGEQLRSLENGDTDQDWAKQLVMQGMRTLRNLAEIDAATAIKVGASRATGTAGTVPFATTLDAFVDGRKILHDNGSPMADMQYVGDTTSGAALRKLGVIQNHYQAGSDEERRSGVLQRQFGFMPRESAGIGLHTKGTGASYTTNTAGYAIGATSITLITGTGTVLAGDVVTFAGDTNKYVVKTALTGGVVVLADPGLRIAIAASATAMTVGNNYTANLAFERNAVVGIMRPPLMPANANIDQMPISDPYGMTYLLLQIKQYGMLTWEIHLAWGFKTVNPEFSSIILG